MCRWLLQRAAPAAALLRTFPASTHSPQPTAGLRVYTSPPLPFDSCIRLVPLRQMLLRKEPSKRLSIEQLLQHPWICGEAADARSAGGARGVKDGVDGAVGGEAEAAEARLRDDKMRTFRAHTARLRAACFSVLLQQQAAERAPQPGEKTLLRTRSQQAGREALRRHDSMRGPMLEGEMLAKTFRVFDRDGKVRRKAPRGRKAPRAGAASEKSNLRMRSPLSS